MMTDNDNPKPLYIVTGSTDSMGSVISRKLAEQGKAVLLASRDIQKAENYAAQLRTVTRNKDISCLQLDLNSFELVNDFVDRGRIKRVYVQGDAPYRMYPDDLRWWYVRNAKGGLREEYCLDPDLYGMHLNDAGCQALISYIQDNIP